MAQEITLIIEDDVEAAYLFDRIALKWKYDEAGTETKKEFITRILGQYLKVQGILGAMDAHEATERAVIDAIQIVAV